MNLKTYDAVSMSLLLSQHGSTVVDAVRLAAYAHDGVFRREFRPGVTYKDPYVAHPMRNALRMVKYVPLSGDLVILIVACLLHDVVEDAPERAVEFMSAEFGIASSGTTHAERALDGIARLFGNDIADIVDRVTNPPTPKGTDRADRNKAYVEHLVDKVVDDRRAWLVKASDLIDNAGSIKHMDDTPERARFAARYVPALAAMLTVTLEHGGDVPDMVRRLAQVSDEIADLTGEKYIADCAGECGWGTSAVNRSEAISAAFAHDKECLYGGPVVRKATDPMPSWAINPLTSYEG